VHGIPKCTLEVSEWKEIHMVPEARLVTEDFVFLLSHVSHFLQLWKTLYHFPAIF